MNNNYEQEKPHDWREEINNEILQALERENPSTYSYLQLTDVNLKEIDQHMLDLFEKYFPSVIPSKIYSHEALVCLANEAGFHGEMPRNLNAQPLYFIVSGDNAVAFLPLENIEEDRIDCYFFHRYSIAFQHSPILREKYSEVHNKLNKD